MYNLDLEKAEEPEINCQPLLDHRESKGITGKKICFNDYAKSFDCVDYSKLWKILKKDGNMRPPYLLPEKPVAGQEAIVRTRYGTMDWFKIGKGVHQGCILSPCLFTFYAEYIMQNARLDEVQAESRLLGEIAITSDMQMTPPLWQKAKRN